MKKASGALKKAGDRNLPAPGANTLLFNLITGFGN